MLPGAEISLEANPGTLSYEYLLGLFELGVNRISLGVQSANPERAAPVGTDPRFSGSNPEYSLGAQGGLSAHEP